MTDQECSCYWDENRLRIVGSRKNKIKEFLRNKMIVTKVVDDKGIITHHEIPGIYYLLPSTGRHTIHEVNLSSGMCTCQHYKAYLEGKEDNVCTHWDAVQIFIRRIDESGSFSGTEKR